MSEQQVFSDAGGPWRDASAEIAIQRARAEMVIAVASGRAVRMEDILASIETPEGYDRRSFGLVAQALHRRGIIAKAGTVASDNRRHHAGIKQRWVLATADPCCPTCGQPLGGDSDAA